MKNDGLYQRDIVQEHTFDNIKNFIRDRLIGLRTFFGGRDRFQNPRNAQPIYYRIAVNTINSGLTIDSSPAYFVNWTYFDHPSTPAHGDLLGGRWIFAGRSQMMNLTVAQSIVQIPQTQNINLYDF